MIKKVGHPRHLTKTGNAGIRTALVEAAWNYQHTPKIGVGLRRRRDGRMSRGGSVHLRRALLELGNGLRFHDPAGRAYAHQLAERGKPGGVIACALAKRASEIAYAMVRDQIPYDPTRWS